MPIYEYHCLTCDKKFEEIRSIHDADKPIACKYCNNHRTERTITSCFNHSGGEANPSSACSGCSGHSCATCSH